MTEISDYGAADHWNHRSDEDYFSQIAALFHLMSDEQKQVLFENTTHPVGCASKAIQGRHIANCNKADPAYGADMVKALKEISKLSCLFASLTPFLQSGQ